MANPPPDPPDAPRTGTPCNGEEARNLVGLRFDPATYELARGYAGTVRVLQPGMVMTMDHREERLIIHLDAYDRVTSAICG